MIEFLLTMAVLGLILRSTATVKGQARWRARWEKVEPVVRHVGADVRAIRTNARARRETRKWDL